MRVAVLFRAGGAAASAQTVQAERAAEAMRRNGWRGEARRAIRAGAWPERRREGLKPAGPGQPAGPVRSTKARRRSRHAIVNPCDTARESQSPEHSARLRRLSACHAPEWVGRAPCRKSRRRSSLPASASARCGNARTRRTTGRHPSACARSCGGRSAGRSVSSRRRSRSYALPSLGGYPRSAQPIGQREKSVPVTRRGGAALAPRPLERS